MQALWLGTVDYSLACELQRELSALRARNDVGDIVLLMEHPAVITLGRGADARHILASTDRLARLGIAVHETDRGGDVTYHGPGQLVGYPILDLARRRKDLHWYLRKLEEALIVALAEYGVEAGRFPPHTGVWVHGAKIAAIGVKVSRWISTHGFALNVCPEMDHFDLIVPCGIRSHGVTSLRSLTQGCETPADLAVVVAQALDATFGPPEATPAPQTPSLSPASAALLAHARVLRFVPSSNGDNPCESGSAIS